MLFFFPKVVNYLQLASLNLLESFLITLSPCLAQPETVISEGDMYLEPRTSFVGGLSKAPSLLLTAPYQSLWP